MQPRVETESGNINEVLMIRRQVEWAPDMPLRLLDKYRGDDVVSQTIAKIWDSDRQSRKVYQIKVGCFKSTPNFSFSCAHSNEDLCLRDSLSWPCDIVVLVHNNAWSLVCTYTKYMISVIWKFFFNLRLLFFAIFQGRSMEMAQYGSIRRL